MRPSVDVIIPVYKPGEDLKKNLKMLSRQSVLPDHILLVNTEEKWFDVSVMEGLEHISVIHIKKSEFDHGGTRHMASSLGTGAFMLFMTQDAIPADSRLIENLLKAFEDPQVAAAYARQLPDKKCNVLEKYTRGFNYGAESRVKTADDLPVLGIKTFFCSNVCAMYRRSVYEKMGGFPRKTIFNEDMIFAGGLIKTGYAIAYCADAKVIHSHNYSGIQQFHRNFDLGVSQAEHPEIFEMAKSESEGIRMIKQTAVWLMKTGRPLLLPKLIWQSGCKWIGYRLGKGYRKLPEKLILRCTSNPSYWK